MWDRTNGVIQRAGVVLLPQTSCPIALGDVGDWCDANDGSAVKRRLADGTDVTLEGSGDVQVIAVDAVADSALAANTYDNGTAGVGATLTKNSNGSISPIDGVTITAGMRVLITGEATTANNGLYTVTNVGGGTKYKLTRDPLFDESGEMIKGTLFTVKAGSVYASTTWKYTGADSPTVGTTALTFAAAPLSITYGAGGDMAAAGVASANAAGVANKVARADHVHAPDTTYVAVTTNALEMTNKTLTTQVVKNGLTATGATANDFSGSTGAFKTSTGTNTIGGKIASTATAWLIADPGNGGAISVATDGVCALTSAGAETRTLAIPTYVGQRITLVCDTYVGNIVVTVASAFDSAAHTTITFGAAGKAINLVGVTVGGTRAWRLAYNDGTTLG